MAIERQYRTFTANDTLAFLLFPNAKPICLGTLTTLSWSLLREKEQVSVIGRINVAGFTRGLRVIAGTMIFTMINQHWVNDLVSQIPSLQQYKKLKADELPIFDIMLVCANESGASVTGFIYGVDLTDESGVISVQDLFIENTCKFLARDIDTFDEYDYNTGKFIDGGYAISQSLSYDENKIYFNAVDNSDKSESDIKILDYTKENVDALNNAIKAKAEKNVKANQTAQSAKKSVKAKSVKAMRMMSLKSNIESTGNVNIKDINSVYEQKYDLINNRKYKVPVYEKKDTSSSIVRYLNSYETFSNYKVDDDFIVIDDGYVLKSDLIIKEPFVYSTQSKKIIDTTYDNLFNENVSFEFSNFLTSVSFKVSAISYYSNNKKQCFIKMIYFDKGNYEASIGIKQLPQSYVYNPKIEELPNKIEFIVTPIGYTPYKKIIRFDGGDN